MRKKLWILCCSIEINLFLWLMIFGCIWVGGRTQMFERTLSHAKTISLIGGAF